MAGLDEEQENQCERQADERLRHNLPLPSPVRLQEPQHELRATIHTGCILTGSRLQVLLRARPLLPVIGHPSQPEETGPLHFSTAYLAVDSAD